MKVKEIKKVKKVKQGQLLKTQQY